MKKVVVTGANGQLSNCLEDVFLNEHQIDSVFLSIDDLDITDHEAVLKYFQNNKFDFIINCAAYTAVDKAEEEYDLAYKVNVTGTKNLSEICKNQNITLIHISTDYVFNGCSSKPYTEIDQPKPISVYGKTKLESEEILIKKLSKYYILRTSWLYSEYGHNFFNTMLKLGNEKKELKIIYDQIGTPTYAKDLAEVINVIIKKKHKLEFGIYHFSNEGVASWYDFAIAIFKQAKLKTKVLPIKTEQYPTPAKRPYYSILSKEKIKNYLDIEISYWKESLNKCINNSQL